MKIFNKYISFLLVITLLSVTACSEDDATGFSTLVPTNPTISVTGGGNYSVNEIDKDEYTFNITLSEPQIVDVTVHVLATGEATLGEDYVLSASSVVIPAYRTSGKFTLSILSDEEFEETETLTLQIGDDRTANANLSPVNAVFTIANYVPPIPTKSDIVDFTLSWDFADFTYNGQDICDLIDDLDVTFQEPGDAGMYDSDLTGYALSSLACPEHGTLE
jgi:Calx-beta domain.